MKKKIYITIIILLTFITSISMTYLHPNKEEILPSAFIGFMEGFANQDNDESKVNHIIEDEMLGKFTEFYAGKELSELKPYQKEELRYILESIGLYNIEELKKLLSGDFGENEEKIYTLLSENLFDEDIMKINELLE